MTKDETSSFDLRSIDIGNPDVLASLKALKNRVIGCKRTKLAFIEKGATKCVLKVLEQNPDPGVAVQAAQTLGSFAAHSEGAKVILQQNGIPILLKTLESEDERLLEAALRALKLLLKSGTMSTEDLLGAQKYIGRLSGLLSTLEPPVVAESASVILSKCMKSPDNQNLMMHEKVMIPLVKLLALPPRSRQQAALEALCEMLHSKSDTVAGLLKHCNVLELLLDIAKHSETPRLRFLACQALVVLAPKTQVLAPSSFSSGHQENFDSLQEDIRLSKGSNGIQKEGNADALCSKTENIMNRTLQYYHKDVECEALPVLVQLLNEPSVGADAAPILRELIRNRPSLQSAAVDADCISKLVSLARENSVSSRSKAAILSTLAVLCADIESHRQQLIDVSALPFITNSLSDPSELVRTSACSCLRSLSRSTSLLRHAIKIDPIRNVVKPLLAIQGSMPLVLDAAATLSNFAVEYSTIKDEVLKQDGIAKFVSLARSLNGSLRLHGIWGLSSFAYLGTLDVKLEIMNKLSWKDLEQCLNDDESSIRSKALLLLRNLMHGKRPSPDVLGSWNGWRILPVLLRSLQNHNASRYEHQHALYAIVNIASGNIPEKDLIMGLSGLPDAISRAFDHEDSEVREAAIWAIINLSTKENDSVETVQQLETANNRISAFENMGVPEKLKILTLDDTSMSVRERAEVALSYFGIQRIIGTRDFRTMSRSTVSLQHPNSSSQHGRERNNDGNDVARNRSSLAYRQRPGNRRNYDTSERRTEIQNPYLQETQSANQPNTNVVQLGPNSPASPIVDPNEGFLMPRDRRQWRFRNPRRPLWQANRDTSDGQGDLPSDGVPNLIVDELDYRALRQPDSYWSDDPERGPAPRIVDSSADIDQSDRSARAAINSIVRNFRTAREPLDEYIGQVRSDERIHGDSNSDGDGSGSPSWSIDDLLETAFELQYQRQRGRGLTFESEGNTSSEDDEEDNEEQGNE